MSFNTIGFLQHYGIDHIMEGHKHCTYGWVQVKCPFCSVATTSGWHLGYNLNTDWWNCWKCGAHRTWDVLLALLDGNRSAAKDALARFKGRPTGRYKREANTSQILEVPAGLQPLTPRARKYLRNRKFDPDLLATVWGLQSTANIGPLKNRIYIPITLNNQPVSWQCRDIIGTSKIKYIAQETTKEIINNKDTVYGLDQATGRTCVVVEGAPDCWRLGPGAVGLFGISYRPTQVAVLLAHFDTFHILFDPEAQAQAQALKLGAELSAMDRAIKIWTVEDSMCDPGEWDQTDADDFMRQTLGSADY